ncbi:hypothetical protein F5884DRAFT_97061 [Xylogone sp. PMI_703]|nr:hypothetical protein F5884DRAFT_97061 [Xylogone sp. PMI_703]
MSGTTGSEQSKRIQAEIAELERRLQDAKARLIETDGAASTGIDNTPPSPLNGDGALNPPAHHFLLLLSDSALPLGSFAFSGGLESYLAHTRPHQSFHDFLNFSLTSYASTTLPFVLAAYRNPVDLMDFDDTLDAAIVCTVGRRASIAQGRALLSIWDRSFSAAASPHSDTAAITALNKFNVVLRSTPSSSAGSTELPGASAHLGPLFGAIAYILGLSLRQTAYVFMLSQVKALLSAAVRASMFGPYHAQKVLASVDVQLGIQKVIDAEWHTKVEDAGQRVPMMDLWIGRHEMLYSRIFNS